MLIEKSTLSICGGRPDDPGYMAIGRRRAVRVVNPTHDSALRRFREVDQHRDIDFFSLIRDSALNTGYRFTEDKGGSAANGSQSAFPDNYLESALLDAGKGKSTVRTCCPIPCQVRKSTIKRI